MDNIQIYNNDEKEIYITAPNILSERNKDLPDIFQETEQNENKGKKIKRKFQLPPILKFRNSHNTHSQSILERENNSLKIHSYFSPENFLDYNPSCNKFSSKISPFLKESLSPEKIIYKKRIYDLEELKMLSDLKKDQIIKRSPGQGIFMRIQTYKHLNKRIPFQLVLSSLSAGRYNENNNNDDDDFEANSNYKKDKNNFKSENLENNNFSPKKDFKFKKSIRPKIHHLYKEKKFIPRRSSVMIKPNNDIIKTFKQPPKVASNEMENNINLNKILELDNKFRDKNILNALEKCGEDDIKYLIINN